MISLPDVAKRIGTPVLLAVAVAATAGIPLFSNRSFYFWDDSAAAFAPGWYAVGERLLAGSWPTLIPDMWAGGNLPAEALYGTYNPVILADSLLIASVPNLAVGITLVKMQFLAILAVGVYVVARQYGATRSMSFVAGFGMPFAGYTLYFDASSWASGLIAFAWIPHVWWSTRASAQGRLNPLVPFVFGFLALTTGNPYGAVGVAVVYLAVIGECVAFRRYSGLARLLWSGASVLLATLIVYLPLAFTTEVSVRTQGGAHNDGFLRPDLGDVLNASAFSNRPDIPAFGQPVMTVPLVYLVWFIVPLAPWIRWNTLRTMGRRSVSLILFGAVYGVLLLGPSQLWLFRWPVRLIEYGQLPVMVATAVVLSAGLHRSHVMRRSVLTGGLLLVQFYLSWSNVPEDGRIHLVALGIAAALVVSTVGISMRNPRALSSALAVGIVVVLAVQTNAWFPGNCSVTPWKFPRHISFYEDHFRNRYPGTTFVIAHPENIPSEKPTDQWGDILFGNVWQPAGVKAVNSYAGISYEDFVDSLCLNYYGGVECPDAVDRLLAKAPGTSVSWLDALRLGTVVVQNSGPYGGTHALDRLPPGEWTVTHDGTVTVGHRIAPQKWPDGRLSASPRTLHVLADNAATDTRETVEFTGSGTATFALLAWPGWSARVDGRPAQTSASPGGLLQVKLPPTRGTVSTLTLEFSPPGTFWGRILTGLGLVLALMQGAWHFRGRRRGRRNSQRGDQPDAVTPEKSADPDAAAADDNASAISWWPTWFGWSPSSASSPVGSPSPHVPLNVLKRST
ncbi:hypothetical protein MLGJGCBP_02740 [Rhodococcus sp. T7]|nr:hypothetical protein MLGJGCBP_02740 [Rhodococcus sp. T7]